MTLTCTPPSDIIDIRNALSHGFTTGLFRSIDYRKEQITQLAHLLQDNADAFIDALASDLGRPYLEAAFLEQSGVLQEAEDALKHLDQWARPERPPFHPHFFFMKPCIRKEPKGVVLIIGPFNYPLWTTLSPLVGAIAAGNAVVVKPSELTPSVAALMAKLFPIYLDQRLIRVVNGGVPETTALLELQWDHILFTGSRHVGRVVARAAAEYMAPVTLELGGKSPVILDTASSADLHVATRRILWGKSVNAGQTCVAPDYVLVLGGKSGLQRAVQAFQTTYATFYPSDYETRKSVGRIITSEHFTRLQHLLLRTQGSIVAGGLDHSDEAAKYIPPTVVSIEPHDVLMESEIFGPILPIISMESAEDAVEFIRKRDTPLALYVFTRNDKLKNYIFDNTQSGSAVANGVLLQAGVFGLPFGGVGASGYGQHTGVYSFTTFSHLRASIDVPGWLRLIKETLRIDHFQSIFYPPYTPQNAAAVMKLLPTIGEKRARRKMMSFVVTMVVLIAAVAWSYPKFAS